MRSPLLVLLALYAGAPAFAGLRWQETLVTVDPEPLADQAEAVFRYTNEGDAPVTILAARGDCGCTVVDHAQRRVAPGGSGEIRAVFAFGEREGPQHKRITVTTDEAGETFHELTLEVDIPKYFEVRPASFVIWKAGETYAPKTLMVRALHSDVVRPVSVESRDRRVSARLEPSPDNASDFNIVLQPEADAGPLSTQIVVTGSAPAGDPRVIVLYAFVR